MSDKERRSDHADVIAGLFAIMTGRLEDGAGIAAASQARLPASALRDNVDDLRGLLDEAAMLLGAITALLAEDTVVANADDK